MGETGDQSGRRQINGRGSFSRVFPQLPERFPGFWRANVGFADVITEARVRNVSLFRPTKSSQIGANECDWE